MCRAASVSPILPSSAVVGSKTSRKSAGARAASDARSARVHGRAGALAAGSSAFFLGRLIAGLLLTRAFLLEALDRLSAETHAHAVGDGERHDVVLHARHRAVDAARSHDAIAL